MTEQSDRVVETNNVASAALHLVAGTATRTATHSAGVGANNGALALAAWGP